MLHAPFIMLALAGPAEDCDFRATIAGELMDLYQNGASAVAVSRAAQSSPMPSFALHLVTRIVVAETSGDADARDLASFHFATEIHAECRVSDFPTS